MTPKETDRVLEFDKRLVQLKLLIFEEETKMEENLVLEVEELEEIVAPNILWGV
ncbi:MAG: hypothetical protein LAO21_02060 [Acidobacteriia bacterium]|nr:hypothetical protein [Terriglobia bacterium]